MAQSSRILQYAWMMCAVLCVVAISLILHGTANAGDEPQSTEENCLSCHNDTRLVKEMPDGEELSLSINIDSLAHSVHGQVGIECQACHADIQTYPHPEQDYRTLRELSRAYVQACQKCHSDIFDKTVDSMHNQAAQSGNVNAPICTDCHGAHDIQSPDQPRSKVSTTCGKCHGEIFATYTQSVHGNALLEEDNADVPVCTDCHGVHNIQDPRTQQFRIESPELCGGCHGNQELMSKYGIPANVYDLYKLSWHGVDVSVYKARWPNIWHDSAVCTDCHGIHNIKPASDPTSDINPQNLLVTCQKCHPNAGPNWVDAWVGHNEITPQRTPWLYNVQVFYSYFVPIVLWLCVLYVALQIIRVTVERVKRSLS
jgi:nitrate/TMAO reductase-like tetraheme cytochrome c subunit